MKGWIVKQLVAGAWRTVDNHKVSPPVPRVFHYKVDAEAFARELATLKQPTRVERTR